MRAHLEGRRHCAAVARALWEESQSPPCRTRMGASAEAPPHAWGREQLQPRALNRLPPPEPEAARRAFERLSTEPLARMALRAEPPDVALAALQCAMELHSARA